MLARVAEVRVELMTSKARRCWRRGLHDGDLNNEAGRFRTILQIGDAAAQPPG